MPDKQKSATIASLAVAGIIVAAGAGAAINANAETPTPTPSSSASQSAPARTGGEQGPRGGDRGNHTEATTEQTSQVSAAVKAKDSAVTVDKVMVDEDGSYDVAGTKDGERVMFEVSKDLKTVTERQGGPGGKGGHGERGGHFADASTDETAKVTAAVKAKDSAVSVEKVGKLDDGSFVAMGTKSGERVGFKVSADYKTVTAQEFKGGPDGKGGRGNHTEATAAQTTQVTAAVKAKDSAVTVERVMVDEDGSYDVAATKSGDRVMFEVSKDLKTVTQKEKPQR